MIQHLAIIIATVWSLCVTATFNSIVSNGKLNHNQDWDRAGKAQSYLTTTFGQVLEVLSSVLACKRFSKTQNSFLNGLVRFLILLRQPDSVGTALSFTAVLFRQPDVSRNALSFTAVLSFFPGTRHSAAVQSTAIKCVL